MDSEDGGVNFLLATSTGEAVMVIMLKNSEKMDQSFTAEIGPFSSNWDRACDLFAVIKGTQVDYGTDHAIEDNHKQTGRQYKGLYKRWGGKINGKVNKVHFIAHSMGGPTIRMLAHLLYHGVKNTPMEAMVDKSHPLYSGGNDWIDSITFLESPLTGLVLADKLQVLQFLAYPALRLANIYPLSPVILWNCIWISGVLMHGMA